MDQLIQTVLDGLHRQGLVEVEISARHVHLAQRHLEVLFGVGATLTPKRPLSQPGQYLSEQRVTIEGKKGRMENIAILGPVRSETQVELSKSDCVSLGIQAPVRESGNLSGSASVTIIGPCGSLLIEEGAIIAQAHIHLTPPVAHKMKVSDRQRVTVQILSPRPIVLEDVTVRVSSSYSCRMHIDFDEANAAMVNGFTLGKVQR